MIRALISDFGGVLTSPLSAGFLAYQEEARISLEELGAAMQAAADAYGEHPLYALERGEISERSSRAASASTCTTASTSPACASSTSSGSIPTRR